jgi:heterotetrameric sarcosine oxidase gamma subunit
VKLQPKAILCAPFGTAAALAGFKAAGVMLRERADIGCVLVTSAVDSGEVVATAGVELPLGHGEVKNGALWLSPRSWLVRCRIEEELPLVMRVNAAFPDKRVHAVRFTDALCWLELSGAEARGCLTEGGFVSLEPGGLPVGHAKRTWIAAVAAVVVHESDSVWLVAVERSRGRHFADWLIGNSHAPPFRRLS